MLTPYVLISLHVTILFQNYISSSWAYKLNLFERWFWFPNFTTLPQPSWTNTRKRSFRMLVKLSHIFYLKHRIKWSTETTCSPEYAPNFTSFSRPCAFNLSKRGISGYIWNSGFLLQAQNRMRHRDSYHPSMCPKLDHISTSLFNLSKRGVSWCMWNSVRFSLTSAG